MNIDKNYIITNTARLIKKYGIKSLTVNDITLFNNISKSKLYVHFKNKEEIITACLYLINEEFKQKIPQEIVLDNDPISKLIGIFDYTTDFLKKFEPIFYFDLKKNQSAKKIIREFQKEYKFIIIKPILTKAKNENYLAKNIATQELIIVFFKLIDNYFLVHKTEDAVIKQLFVIRINKYLAENYKFQYLNLIL